MPATPSSTRARSRYAPPPPPPAAPSDPADAADDEVRIEIRDTGHGIAAENLPRIFEPFFTTKPVGKGTGLGLSLAYSIVQRHQGRIEVDSAPGSGSVFRLVLPVRPARADA